MAYNISKVHFVGESGVDTGGLNREFWRLLVVDIVHNIALGSQDLVFLLKELGHHINSKCTYITIQVTAPTIP